MDPLIPNPELYNVTYQADSYQSMPYRFLGRSGLQGPAIGLGTWKFGYPETGDEARIGPELAMTGEAARLFDAVSRSAAPRSG